MLTVIRVNTPGLLVALVIAGAASFVADHHGGPTLLYALLLGMALNHLSSIPRYRTGIQLAAGTVLRIGVALLGARITLDQVAALGWQLLILVVIGVPLTITSGLLLARWFGLQRELGALTGVAVAICGASAAMAMSSVLPQRRDSESWLIFTVIGVTSLSTIAMIAYPPLALWLGLDAQSSGVFLGATIHDVAQVVGAGYLLGDEAGHTATITKLLRVAMLVPVVVVMSLLFRQRSAVGQRPPLLPLFLIAFIALVALNSYGWISPAAQSILAGASRWCLVTAIAAVGMKADLRKLAQLGWRPLGILVLETLILALFVVTSLLSNPI